MNNFNPVLENEEKIIFRLRELYARFGYMKYRMSKFEEYDLYVRNKDFLVSENIITFTDIDGKLMALKPDVTLSIIKNSRDNSGAVQKMYYNENVYRASSGTRAFKELMQVGLECFGDIDDYCICEVVGLAAKSLECISDDYILDISHMGIVSDAIDCLTISKQGKKAILKCLGEKNVQGIDAVYENEGIDASEAELFKKLIEIYGEPEKVIKELRKVSSGEKFEKSIDQLEEICQSLADDGCKGKIHIDFSVVNDMNYYSGVVFKGFVNGVPEGVLSGGQYDNLMKKMSRNSGAIGFAVYLDVLDRFFDVDNEFDVDIVLLYDDKASVSDLSCAMKKLSANGERVVAQRVKPEKLRYKKLMKLSDAEVRTLEENA